MIVIRGYRLATVPSFKAALRRGDWWAVVWYNMVGVLPSDLGLLTNLTRNWIFWIFFRKGIDEVPFRRPCGCGISTLVPTNSNWSWLQTLTVDCNRWASRRSLKSAMELLNISATTISDTFGPHVGALDSLQTLGAAFLPLTGALPDDVAT
jgi:hypothetical protein